MWQRSLQQRRIRERLLPLPSAQQEVEQLRALFAQGQFWQDSQAVETAFKAQAPQYDVLHLAMHGLINIQEPSLSALVFTEDGTATDDNFLYAYEIMPLRLSAKLVVLSACETGHGKFEEGDGIQSLARSFMYAGVPSTVVSLWQVNDYATSKIMALFLGGLAVYWRRYSG